MSGIEQEITRIWNKYDVDGSGVLEKQEVMNFLNAICTKKNGLENAQTVLFQYLDNDGDNKVTKQEIRDLIKSTQK